jgi:hypothetical protein
MNRRSGVRVLGIAQEFFLRYASIASRTIALMLPILPARFS